MAWHSAAPTHSANDERATTTLEGLRDRGLVPPNSVEDLREVVEKFSLPITPEMRRASTPADPNDPITRQFVPTRNELQVRNEERADPIGDGVFTKTRGLIHRYPDRVVLQPTQTCQVYCRYCFRREKVGAGTENLKADELAAALDYVRRSPDRARLVETPTHPDRIFDAIRPLPASGAR